MSSTSATIRSLFSEARPLDRRIEKVIDYAADEPSRLRPEIEEYVVTERIERSFRTFIEVYERGVSLGDVTEVGLWVSGFYGSGKSSFTKYLGFALDPNRQAGELAFLDRLVEHFRDRDLQQLFRVTASRFPAAVVMLDLGREQLVESTSVPIANVLYAKVLREVGHSSVPILADVEVRLAETDRLDAFRAAYREQFPGKGEWNEVHDDPLLGPARAARLVPAFFPGEFPTPDSFRGFQFQERLKVEDLARRMIRLVRQRTGRENILFLVDEVGQYVAPRTDLMLNLDGLVRSFKEIGRGKVWLLATAQQTLNEIVEKAVLNSAELVRLRDRFPISIELDAADIREITHRRLLTKRTEGERQLQQLFCEQGEAIKLQTRVEGFGTSASRELTESPFVQMYPFLPVHFDVLMALIRRLARRTGGTGLRSAIRVVQDLLIDASGTLRAGQQPLADRPVRLIAGADDLFDTLRNDIAKELPHVVEGVDKVIDHPRFGGNPLAVRVAKAIAALQPLEDFPRTVENLAALLYPSVGAPPVIAQVRELLHELVAARELGVVEVRGEQEGEHPGAAGYLFLSDKVRPLQQSRDQYRPTGSEKRQVEMELLRRLFDPQPEVRLENVKAVRAGLTLNGAAVAGEGADLRFALEPVSEDRREPRVDELKVETRIRSEWHNQIVWVVTFPADLDDLLTEACRSAHVGRSTSEHDADRDVAQYLRSERQRHLRLQEAAQEKLRQALLGGDFVFQGLARTVREHGETVTAACNVVLGRAAEAVFSSFRHAPINARGDQAAKFLEWEQLHRMPKERDPLGLVAVRGGRPTIRKDEPPLSEVMRVFREKVDAAGTARLQGSVVQDLFAAPPYGWSKDTTRYLFAALLTAGEIEIHTGSGALRTPGPAAEEAVRNTAAFNRVGISPRGSRPSVEMLDLASRRIGTLFPGGDEVMPLEDHISRAVRRHVPLLMESVASLPDRLRLLGLPGMERAQRVQQSCADLLQDDAGGAAALLGAAETSLPDDVSWARKVADALDRGEAQIQRASALRSGLLELEQLFPSAREHLPEKALKTLGDVLASEQFAERMDELRGALAAADRAVEAGYAAVRSELVEAVRQARDQLEKAPGWALLDPGDETRVGDRSEIERLLALDAFPETPSPNPSGTGALGAFRRLLARQARQQDLLRAALEEIARRQPVAPEEVETTEERAPPARHSVALRTLLPAEPLRSADEVDRWLRDLRARLLDLVELGPVEVVDREEN